MKDTYSPLISSILESSVWGLPDGIRLVWVTMLAMKDREGFVWASVPGLAHRARVSLEVAQEAIRCFQEPDPYSRTPDYEGRRIEAVDGGWRILNSEKYRIRRDPEARREQNREAKRRQRRSAKGQRQPSPGKILADPPGSAHVSHGQPRSADPDPDTTTLPAPAGGRKMPGPAGEVLRAFDEGHRRAFGVGYLMVPARDQAVLKGPLKVYGLPRLLELVEAFWSETKKAQASPDDPKYAAGRAKPNIPGFIGQIPNLLRRYKFTSKVPDGA